MGVWANEEIAYVVTNRDGLYIVNIQNPHRPTRLGFLAVSGRLPDIVVAEPYAYIATNSGLHVVDISNPRQPTPVSFIDFPGFAADLTLSANRLYFTNEFQGLVIVDISDSAVPRVLQTVPLNSMVWDVVISDDTAYVASTEPGLHVIGDLRGMRPTPVFQLQEPNSLWALAISQDKLFGVNIDGDLHILSLTEARKPVPVGTYDAPGYSTRVAVHGERVYVIADVDGNVYEINPDASGVPTAMNLHLAPGFTVAIAATDDGFVASCERLALWAGKDQENRHYSELIFPAAWRLKEVAIADGIIYGISDDIGVLWVDNTADRPLRYGMLKLKDDVPSALVALESYVYVGGAKGLYVLTHEGKDTNAVIGFVETPGTVDILGAAGDLGYAVVDSLTILCHGSE